MSLESPSFDLDTVIRRSDAILSSTIADDVVAMDIEHGTYFGLEAVAARFWELIAEPKTVGALCDRFEAEYQVSPEQCRHDLLAFVSDLLQHRIVQIDTPTSR